MAKYLDKKLNNATVSFKFGVRCWRSFCDKYKDKSGNPLPLSQAFQKVVVVTKDSPDGDVNLDAAVDLIYFAAKDAAASKGKDADSITPEKVEEWIEDLGFMNFISEAVEFAAERFADQQKKPEDAQNTQKQETAKKKT